MSKRIYAVSATRQLLMRDREFMILALRSEGLDDAEINYDEMHHGAADGGDKFLAALFTEWGYVVQEHPADWATHGKKAGPIRNRSMLDAAKPERLYAFPTKASTERERSKGTVDCIAAAIARDIDVKVWWLT